MTALPISGPHAADTPLDQLCVNTLRCLAMDAVQAAGTGHPGTAMGAADAMYVLWSRFLRHNPANPAWPNRDRFVLSAGHAAILQYSLLYLSGYGLTLDDLKQYRRFGSLTPGHPELGLTPGVEATTGPLGQGFGMGVGMALAAEHLAARFNRPGFNIIDHFVYALVSDGDLMEGVAAEAASLAGHLRLGRLIYIYDDNRTTIEGSTDLTLTEDRGARFEAYGWHVQRVDGHDRAALAQAIAAAQADPRPSLIISRSHIAYGSPNKQDSSAAHGAPLGEDEVRLTKARLGWPETPAFYVPPEVLAHFRQALERGQAAEQAWQDQWRDYAAQYPDLAAELEQAWAGELPEGWAADLPVFEPQAKPLAPRAAIGQAIRATAHRLPALVGGSADLAPSTQTTMVGVPDFSAGNREGRNLHFGVREHGMGAILNGMALYGGLIPYGSTYLVFSDYMRPAIRLAALMNLHVIYIFTHDSVLVGEDGPTHQPVEQLSSLRSMPNLTVLRPADAAETVAAWRWALEHRGGPVALVLARHAVPVLPRPPAGIAADVGRGAYIAAEAPSLPPDLILIATGSEVHLALEARTRLAQLGLSARVVSMPCPALFDRQCPEYREAVLPEAVTARLAIEAGAPDGWYKYVGLAGDVVGVSTFGAPGSLEDLRREFGLTTEAVVERALALCQRHALPA